jgi:HAD superfamily hydrolase (TIGR01450 family)
MDLDGTVWIGGRMIADALDCLRWLKETGFPLVYLTNNPVRPEGYASRLSMHGLPTEPDEVMTASTILKDHLLEVMPRARLFVLADADVRAQFEPDFAFSEDPSAIDVVVATSPTALDHAGLTIAFRALQRGARFMATNADPSWVSPEGVEVPHAAAVIGALEASSRRAVELVAGKPSRLAAELVQRRLDRPPTEILVVGDNLHTDVRFASENGMTSVLVLTGVGRRDEAAAAPHPPDHILESIAELPALLRARSEA